MPLERIAVLHRFRIELIIFSRNNSTLAAEVVVFACYDKTLNELEFNRLHFLGVPFPPHRLPLFRRSFPAVLLHHRFTPKHSQFRW